MSFLKFFQAVLLLSLAVLWSPWAQATTVAPAEGIDACLAAGGKPGLAVIGKITKVEAPVKVGPGWDGVRCEIGEGEVLKGNAQFPEGPIQAGKPVTWNMVSPTVVASLQVCSQGAEGLFFIYGSSEYDLSSFVLNAACDVPMTKGADGKLYAAPKAIKFKNMAVQQRFMQANPKFLGATGLTGGGTAGLSGADMKVMVQYLSTELYGAGGGSTGAGSGQTGGKKGAEGVTIY